MASMIGGFLLGDGAPGGGGRAAGMQSPGNAGLGVDAQRGFLQIAPLPEVVRNGPGPGFEGTLFEKGSSDSELGEIDREGTRQGDDFAQEVSHGKTAALQGLHQLMSNMFLMSGSIQRAAFLIDELVLMEENVGRFAVDLEAGVAEQEIVGGEEGDPLAGRRLHPFIPARVEPFGALMNYSAFITPRLLSQPGFEEAHRVVSRGTIQENDLVSRGKMLPHGGETFPQEGGSVSIWNNKTQHLPGTKGAVSKEVKVSFGYFGSVITLAY